MIVKERWRGSAPLVGLLPPGEVLRLIEAPDLAEAVQERTRNHQPKNLRTWRCARLTQQQRYACAPHESRLGRAHTIPCSPLPRTPDPGSRPGCAADRATKNRSHGHTLARTAGLWRKAIRTCKQGAKSGTPGYCTSAAACRRAADDPTAGLPYEHGVSTPPG